MTYYPVHRVKAAAARSNPVSVLGREFSSQAAFARHVRADPKTVCDWLRDGRMDLMEARLAKADAKGGQA